MSGETRRVQVARAALMEVGRGDIAELVVANRIGDPRLPHCLADGGLTLDETRLVARAFRLGHRSDPEGAPVGCGLPMTDRGFITDCDPGDDCPICGSTWPRTWRESTP